MTLTIGGTFTCVILLKFENQAIYDCRKVWELHHTPNVGVPVIYIAVVNM